MTTLRAHESFNAYVNGQAIAVRAGDLLDSSHIVVSGREKLFSSVEDYVEDPGRKNRRQLAKDGDRGRSDVLIERATADPGERRELPKPKPEADKPKVDEKPKTATRTAKGKQDGEV